LLVTANAPWAKAGAATPSHAENENATDATTDHRVLMSRYSLRDGEMGTRADCRPE
jgi:hypothetical protein